MRYTCSSVLRRRSRHQCFSSTNYYYEIHLQQRHVAQGLFVFCLATHFVTKKTKNVGEYGETSENHSTGLVWALLPSCFCFFFALKNHSTELVWALLTFYFIFFKFLRCRITLQSSFEHLCPFIVFFNLFYVGQSLYRARLSAFALLCFFLFFLRWRITLQSSFEHFCLAIFFCLSVSFASACGINRSFFRFSSGLVFPAFLSLLQVLQ